MGVCCLFLCLMTLFIFALFLFDILQSTSLEMISQSIEAEVKLCAGINTYYITALLYGVT